MLAVPNRVIFACIFSQYSTIIARALFVVHCVQDCLREVVMALVCKNTFLEFVWAENGDARIRSRSAPAVLANRSGRTQSPQDDDLWRVKKRRRNDKRQRELADEHALVEFGSLARQELWGLVAKRALRAQMAQVKWKILTEKLFQKATVSKRRASMPFAVYRQLAYSRCSADVHMLWSLGVFRHGANGVELWSADLPLKHPVMDALLSEAKHYVEMWAAGAFQLAMLGSPSKLCKCNSDHSVESLRTVAALSFGLVQGVRLIHLGRELKDGLRLADYGVGPGSVVVLCRD